VNPSSLKPTISKGNFFLLTANNQDACAYETGKSVQITYLISKHKERYITAGDKIILPLYQGDHTGS